MWCLHGIWLGLNVMFPWHMAGLNMRLMLMVDMEAENAWNELIAIKNGKDSAHKVRCLKPVLYYILWSRSRHALLGLKTRERYLTALNVMFHKIIFFLQKFCLISILFGLGKCASVNVTSTLDLLANWHPVLLIVKRASKSKLLTRFTRLCF